MKKKTETRKCELKGKASHSHA